MSTRPALERLAALAPNAFHARLVAIAALGLLAAAAAGLQPADRGALPALAAAFGLGGIGGGLVADGRGRRRVLVGAVLLALAGLALGLLAPPLALVATAACGALLAVATALVVECSPRRGGTALPLLLAPVIALGPLVPAWAGALPALAFLALAPGLAESPRWLWARGRAVEADAVVRRAERAAGAPAITLTRVAPVPPTAATAADLARGGIVPLLAAAALGVGAGVGASAQLGLGIALAAPSVLLWTRGAGTPRRALAGGVGTLSVAAGLLAAAALPPLDGPLALGVGAVAALAALALAASAARSAGPTA